MATAVSDRLKRLRKDAEIFPKILNEPAARAAG